MRNLSQQNKNAQFNFTSAQKKVQDVGVINMNLTSLVEQPVLPKDYQNPFSNSSENIIAQDQPNDGENDLGQANSEIRSIMANPK